MAHVVSPSALSLATNGVVDAILAHFLENNIDAQVTNDIPGRAKELAKVGKPLINLFFYRILPSGFHAATGSNDPLMIRLHCLVTPFSEDTPESEPDPASDRPG